MKSPKQSFRHYWTNIVIPKKEDQLLVQSVSSCRSKKWKQISINFSKVAKTKKTSKQCRDRWLNYLSPKVNKSSKKKDDINNVFDLQMRLGNNWTRIAERMPGWGPNTLKNHFYTTIRRNLRRFNKGRTPEGCIRGDMKKLLKIKEVRKILTMRKNVKAKSFSKMKLTDKTLEEIKEMNCNQVTENVGWGYDFLDMFGRMIVMLCQ
jgi:hypothetical protein